MYQLAKQSKIDKIVSDISKSDAKINADLFSAYGENLRKAVNRVFDNDSAKGDLLRANVSRFAAYKAYHATEKAKNWIEQTDGNTEAAKKVLHIFNRYQTAEYNTTVTRCRTAKQFEGFIEPDNMRLFPNLRWLPSVSHTLREQHRVFYYRVWAKGDPFWNHNTPGSLWNCKCDWEETNDTPTNGNPTQRVTANGLEGNPAITGEVFTDNASYIKKAPEWVEHEALKITRKNNFEWARKKLTTTKHPELNEEIRFSTRGIKEYLNQNHDDYYVKNEMIRRMDKILSNAKYLGTTTYKGKVSEIFEVKINGKTNYLIANWQDDGNLYFYSITNSDKVLIGIKK